MEFDLLLIILIHHQSSIPVSGLDGRAGEEQTDEKLRRKARERGELRGSRDRDTHTFGHLSNKLPLSAPLLRSVSFAFRQVLLHNLDRTPALLRQVVPHILSFESLGLRAIALGGARGVVVSGCFRSEAAMGPSSIRTMCDGTSSASRG